MHIGRFPVFPVQERGVKCFLIKSYGLYHGLSQVILGDWYLKRYVCSCLHRKRKISISVSPDHLDGNSFKNKVESTKLTDILQLVMLRLP